MGRNHGGYERQSFCRHILKGELIGSPDRLDVGGDRKRRKLMPTSENGVAC